MILWAATTNDVAANEQSARAPPRLTAVILWIASSESDAGPDLALDDESSLIYFSNNLILLLGRDA
jgi:hypothetical protein